MKFQVKVNDIDNFLKENGYFWQDREACAELDYEMVVTDQIIEDFLEDGRQDLILEQMPVQKTDGRNIVVNIKVNEFKFILSSDFNKFVEINLSKKWIKYLLKNRQDYLKFAKEYCNKKEKTVSKKYNEKLEEINDLKTSTKDWYNKEIKKIKSIKQTLNDVNTKEKDLTM